MSQEAVFIVCQMPDRSGLPSAVREMRVCASAEPVRQATTISAKTMRITSICGDYTTRAGGSMKSGSVFAVVALVLIAVPAAAHHSFAAEFDSSKPVTLTGKLTKMEWTNPHGWIFLDVAGADGKVVNWAIESGSPNALIRRGLRPADFTLGATVVVKGYQARNGTPTANGTSVTFANGKNFFLGSPNTGAPEEKP